MFLKTSSQGCEQAVRKSRASGAHLEGSDGRLLHLFTFSTFIAAGITFQFDILFDALIEHIESSKRNQLKHTTSSYIDRHVAFCPSNELPHDGHKWECINSGFCACADRYGDDARWTKRAEEGSTPIFRELPEIGML